MQEIEVPRLTFGMLSLGREAVLMVNQEYRNVFGEDNFNEFKKIRKNNEEIPSELQHKVDTECYAKSSKRQWDSAYEDALKVHHAERGILFPDQDRRASLITKLSVSDRRPSSILRILTTPPKFMGEQCKYEQGLILGIALLCAEVHKKEEEGALRTVLTEMDKFLERELFTGKEGDPKPYDIYSYHMSDTNKLIGLSHQYPDPKFIENLWVKRLEFAVRYVGEAPVLYDIREKDIASTVIKIMERSKKDGKERIETESYSRDTAGFRLVPMEGGRAFRDALAARLEEILPKFPGFEKMLPPDNELDPRHGDPHRIDFQRREIMVNKLRRTPVEIIVEALPDYIAELYDVGDFDPKIGVHNGLAHTLYKLRIAAPLAECFWPTRLTHIDHKENQGMASCAYAFNLGIKHRISPFPY